MSADPRNAEQAAGQTASRWKRDSDVVGLTLCSIGALFVIVTAFTLSWPAGWFAFSSFFFGASLGGFIGVLRRG